ncbi:ester cyclase [Actinocrispum sp. NPDC049592]|uniref:ester cyclase n=1 Tax=Actinocrispum sp. NPDC049592 TaxID=3154835 RepID=UPI00343519A2
MTVLARFVEMINTHTLTNAHELIDENIVEEGPIVVDAPTGGGLQTFLEGWTQMLESFPDIHIEVTDTITEGDRTAARISLQATNTGPYRRTQGTNTHATWTGILWLTTKGGKITHFAAMTDRLSILQQLGFIGTDDDLAEAVNSR